MERYSRRGTGLPYVIDELYVRATLLIQAETRARLRIDVTDEEVSVHSCPALLCSKHYDSINIYPTQYAFQFKAHRNRENENTPCQNTVFHTLTSPLRPRSRSSLLDPRHSTNGSTQNNLGIFHRQIFSPQTHEPSTSASQTKRSVFVSSRISDHIPHGQRPLFQRKQGKQARNGIVYQ